MLEEIIALAESVRIQYFLTPHSRATWTSLICNLPYQDASANEWIVPIIQGYVQAALCEVDYSGSGMNEHMLEQMAAEKFDLILISRRSVSRAGSLFFAFHVLKFFVTIKRLLIHIGGT